MGDPPLTTARGARFELRPLTALRFAAALLVFLYHCDATSGFGRYYALGQAGVGFFFVLSGFILTHAYANQIAAGTMLRNARAFYVARFARIYPAHIAAMAVSAATLAAWGGVVWSHSDGPTRALAFAAQLALMQSWIPLETIYLGINAPAWSISVEAFFYALFPVVATLLARSFAEASARRILLAAVPPWALQTAIVLIPHPASVWTVYIFPPLRFLDFFAGMLLGMAFARSTAVPRGVRATALEAAALAVLAGAVALTPSLPPALRYSLALMPVWMLVVFVFARGGGALSRLLAQPLAVRLGEASFAFYLLHVSALTAARGSAPALHPALAGAAAFAAALAAAFALHAFVEQPARAWIRRPHGPPGPRRRPRSDDEHMQFAFVRDRYI